MHNKVSNAVTCAVFIVYLTDAHDSLYKSILACTNSAVADGAIDPVRQPELNVSLWADKKRNMVFGYSVVYEGEESCCFL